MQHHATTSAHFADKCLNNVLLLTEGHGDQHANAAEEDGNQSQNPKEHALCTQHTFQQVATEERGKHTDTWMLKIIIIMQSGRKLSN